MKRAIAICVLLKSGCATTTQIPMDGARLGPVRDVALTPVEVDPAPVWLDAGPELLTDAEHAALAQRAPELLAQALAARTASRLVLGTAHIERCRLTGTVSRAHTVYSARCRVAVVVDGVTIATTHGEAERRARTRGISQAEADRIAQQVRNTLLNVEDTQAVLAAALDAALGALALQTPDASPTGKPREHAMPSFAARRAAALSQLARAKSDTARTLAIYELGEVGQPSDSDAILAAYAQGADVERTIQALAALCAPNASTSIAALPVATETEAITKARQRALQQAAVCAALHQNGQAH